MSGIPSTARVVIIGGGAVGVSALYHLAKAGWTDCVLLEKNELTAGSTWHAAGNVPTFSTSWSLMNMQRYSTELYRGLGAAVDYPMNYHVTGSVRLGHSRERMQEFERARGMGRYQGMALEVLGVDEIKSKYPFLETHDLTGALYDPADGDIDPAQLTQALAKGARDMGATILRFTPATGVERKGGEWIVHTEKGSIRAEIVINAAGYYAQKVGEWFKPYGGRTVPMMVMSHQYLLSEPVAEIEAWSKEVGHKLPLLRDVDSSYYLRQEKTGFNLGPYERNCRAHWVNPDDPFPEDFSFQLFPDDLERLARHFNSATNMTDTAQALALLTHRDIPARAAAFDAFYERWKHDHLVIDTWFSAQAQSSLPGALDTVQALTRHPLFKITTPNKVRALIGTFAMSNPLQFNRADGAGYSFVAEKVLDIDAINPQVAARLLGSFRSYKALEPGRRSLAEAALKMVAACETLSRDVREILLKMLES